MPEKFARIYRAWRESHADWEITLYDAEAMRAMVEMQYPQYLAIYDAYPTWTHRGDVFRYCVLSAKGGVYADLDVEPLGRLDDLIAQSEIFLGCEPASHGHRSGGLPYNLATAFMGSVQGHTFWDHAMSRLERCVGPDVVWSTGPGFLSGAALTAPRESRPDVVAPRYWSPFDAAGKPVEDTEDYLGRVEEAFHVVGAGREPIVSHLWFGSWMSVSSDYMDRHWLRAPSRLKWRWRETRHPELAERAGQFLDGPRDFDRQTGVADTALDGTLAIAVTVGGQIADAEGFARQLAALKSPVPVKGVVLAVDDAQANGDDEHRLERALCAENFRVERVGIAGVMGRLERSAVLADAALGKASAEADRVLLVDANCSDLPASLIGDLASAGRDIVAPRVETRQTGELDPGNARYGMAPGFRSHYRNRMAKGLTAEAVEDYRIVLGTNKSLDVLPVDSVSPRCLLVSSEALRKSGAVFAGEPIAGTVGGLGFVQKLLRGQGTVAGMPNVVVTHAGS
ncbi:glycosyltransferase [Cucumibacter marinus]|uniref:glycosyltransferase n=1 Tax=Cucumibacter marinus TaxID=1121252 RepID=UPI000490004A|nr:glycosyltransferase [Cucumibacter marinus]